MRMPPFSPEYAEVVARIGSRIAELREEQGLTRHQLADDAGISYETLRRIEIGGGCTVDTLCRLLLALDCGFGDLEPA